MRVLLRVVVGLCWLAMLGCSTGSESRSEEGAGQQSLKSSSSAEESVPAGETGRTRPSREVDWEAARLQSERVSESDLEAFARGVRALAAREELLKEEGRDMETRSRAASSPIEVIQIREETLAEMKDALEEAGLELDGFLQAGEVIRGNPLLVERLGAYLEREELEGFFGEEVVGKGEEGDH